MRHNNRILIEMNDGVWSRIAMWVVAMIIHQPFGVVVMLGTVYFAFGTTVAFHLATIVASVGLAVAGHYRVGNIEGPIEDEEREVDRTSGP